jgi:hypothetical protein
MIGHFESTFIIWWRYFRSKLCGRFLLSRNGNVHEIDGFLLPIIIVRILHTNPSSCNKPDHSARYRIPSCGFTSDLVLRWSQSDEVCFFTYIC